jgi:hypothetical protein
MSEDRVFNPNEMAEAAAKDGLVRGGIGSEILGYLSPHVSSLRERDAGFVRDLVYRRAILQSTEENFVLSEKQFKWLLNIAYLNGFRADDEAFWDKYRSVALNR